MCCLLLFFPVDESSKQFCDALDNNMIDQSLANNLPTVSTCNNVERSDKLGSLPTKISTDRSNSQSNSLTPLFQFWKMHELLRDYCCFTSVNYHTTFLGQLIRFEDNFFDLVSPLSNANELSSEVTAKCPTDADISSDPFCAYKIIFPTVDFINLNLPSSKSQWTEQHNRNAILISVTVIVSKRRYPSVLANLEIDEGGILVKATNSIMSLVNKNELTTLKAFTSLLKGALSHIQSTVCTDTIQDLCIFSKLLQQVDAYLTETEKEKATINGKRIVMLYTGTDFKEFLQQKQLDRILTVLSESDYKATEIANELMGHITNKFLEVRNYFGSVESFNSDIALADIGYINGRLQLFKTRIDEIVTKLTTDFSELLKSAFIIVSFDIAQSAFKAISALAAAADPLNSLFGSTVDILEATTELNNAIASATGMDQVSRAFGELQYQTQLMHNRFQENANFLENVRKLVEKDYTADEFPALRERFIQKYNEYNPQVSREDVSGTQALWEALIEETCAVIDGTTSVAGAKIKAAVKSQGLCVNVPVLVTRMYTVFEEIYDFQFDLMTAMASYVRSNVAVEASKNIDDTFVRVAGLNPETESTLSTLSLMGGLSFMTYKTQILKTVNLYCDRLEYEEAGVRPNDCRGPETDISTLISIIKTKCYSTQHTFYYDVPTKPQSPGDKAYVDLDALFNGEFVDFRIPDSDWLVQRDWIGSHEKDYAIYLEEFTVYLPIKVQGIKTFRTIANSVQNSVISPGGTVFVMDEPGSFAHEYRMSSFSQSCASATTNPYTGCENLNIRELCHVSETSPKELYPSIYSQWHLKVYGAEQLTKPNPATDLNIIFGLKLCKKLKDSAAIPQQVQPRVGVEVSSCCPDGQYRPTLFSPCEDCPGSSQTALSGWYCEK